MTLSEYILYSDTRIAICNKPAGMPLVPDQSGDLSLLTCLAQDMGAIYPAHRIDRPVSGIALFAKDREAAAFLSAQFSERRAQKTYWALTRNAPETGQGQLLHYIAEGRGNRSVALSHPAPHAREALLTYRIAARGERFALWEIAPHTGRKHQIRAQLAAIGCPIKGDVKYGDRRANPDRSIALHARSLEFHHPETGLPMRLEAPPPTTEPLWRILGA
ncbi:MAG: RluA family pseudouridine synthase [Saprospiraceae bacterium]